MGVFFLPAPHVLALCVPLTLHLNLHNENPGFKVTDPRRQTRQMTLHHWAHVFIPSDVVTGVSQGRGSNLYMYI